MDFFSILLYSLGAIFFVSAIGVIVIYLRFWEEKQRLPEACKYLDLAQKNENLLEDNKKLQDKNIELQDFWTEANDKKRWLEENSSLLLSMASDRKKQEETKAEYEGYLDKLSVLITQIQDKTIESRKLDSQILRASAAIQTKTEDIRVLTESIDKMKTEKAELEARKASLLKENETQAVENESAVRKLRELQDQVSTETDRLANTIIEYTEKKAELDSCQNQRATVLAEIDNWVESIDKMKTEKAELEARKASLLKENETQAVENESAVRKLRELQDQVGAEVDRLANITAEYTEKKIELDSYQAQKTALLSEIDILKESVEMLRKETNIKPTSNEETLKDLWEPIIYPKLPPARKEKSEQDLLAETKSYIRGKKLYFPDRVLHAFHTSMKCNDISPITVLAGISGTGKSELPKCYAEGMGMHFSMLAVQPRWDSPQDLLGFYNYMENKYKATGKSSLISSFKIIEKKERIWAVVNYLAPVISRSKPLEKKMTDKRWRAFNASKILDLIDTLKSLGFDHEKINSESDFNAYWNDLVNNGLKQKLDSFIDDLTKIGLIKNKTEVYKNFFKFYIAAINHLKGMNLYTLEDQKYWGWKYSEKGLKLTGAARYAHIMIDEFQDINPIDLLFIKSIRNQHDATLTVVGDDDQTIFEWRGATPEYILDPQRHLSSVRYPMTFATCILNQNYRSPQNIVEMSHRLISNNKRRVAKQTIAVRKDTAKVDIQMINSYDFAVDRILKSWNDSSNGQVAVITRKRSQLIPYQKLYLRAGVFLFLLLKI